MALINYIEPTNIGNIFVGLGTLLVAIAFVVILLKFFKPLISHMEIFYGRELRYGIVETAVLGEVAKQKGIDLEAEVIKRGVQDKKSKSFRKKIEEQVYEQIFGKEDEEKGTK